MSGLIRVMVAVLLIGHAMADLNARNSSAKENSATNGKVVAAELGAVGYVSGVRGPEDLLALPNTHWIVVSGLKQKATGGKLFLVDSISKTARAFFPDAGFNVNPQRDNFPACPGPVNADNFSAHGMNISTQANNITRLYVVNHGSREAVEVFEINTAEAEPVISWVGCVPLPEGTMGNAVTSIPGGGLAVTLFIANDYFAGGDALNDRKLWLQHLMQNRPTGHVARWSVDEGWQQLAGTAASGPNGIEASADGQWLWVANWGARNILRIPLLKMGEQQQKDDREPEELSLDFMPDNLRWGDDGQLWVAGAVGTPQSYWGCVSRPDCSTEYAIAKVDPSTDIVSVLAHPDTSPQFSHATTAVKVRGIIWVGANPSDRVAYFPLIEAK